MFYQNILVGIICDYWELHFKNTQQKSTNDEVYIFINQKSWEWIKLVYFETIST